ncbi:Uncharacterised protein [uncultured archaeon]|nr:Uncharacterised protein [uncultured archaeon]
MVENIDRYLSIDAIRGLAVFLMVLAHSQIVLGWAENYSVMLAAPFFLITSGMSYEIFFSHNSNPNNDYKKTESVLRAIMLYFLTILGLFIGSYLWPTQYQFSLLNWSVFQVIAVGYISGPFLPRGLLKESFIILLVFVISIYLRYISFEYLSFLVTGAAPVIPWIAYFLIGRLFHKILVFKNFVPSFKYHIYFLFILFLFVFYFLIYNNLYIGINRHNVVSFIFISIAYFLIFYFLFYFLDYLSINLAIFNPFERVGKISFSSYYIHLGILFLMYLFKKSIHLSLNPSVFNNIIVSMIIILCLYMLEGLWRKHDYFLGAEWLLRSVTRRLLFIIDKDNKKNPPI